MWTTLAFHRQFHTDLVKAMSDYPFPKPAGKWHELKVVNNPFPRAIAGAGADSRRPARPSLFCRDHVQPMERGGEDVVAGRGAATQTGEPEGVGGGTIAFPGGSASSGRGRAETFSRTRSSRRRPESGSPTISAASGDNRSEGLGLPLLAGPVARKKWKYGRGSGGVSASLAAEPGQYGSKDPADRAGGK